MKITQLITYIIRKQITHIYLSITACLLDSVYPIDLYFPIFYKIEIYDLA